ncbi:hypothetical protein OF83DRAFT_1158627 [Amylostereum chailletii]|nr:hypothetical protein OF83DRAFT_1158627 [Amylostereum chailletii]
MSMTSSPTISVASLPSDVSVGTLTPQYETPEHDDYFYFDNVIFKAGNVVFKVVPQYSLPIDDPGFTALLKPAPGDKQPCGMTDNDPILLPAEVTPADFRSLLKACNPKPSNRTAMLTLDEWMSVLKLAKIWSLDSLRPKAIEESEKLFVTQSPLEKIILGKKYNISKWLIEGYEAFGKRDGMVSATERAKLGIDTYVGLVELRERAASHIIQNAISTISSTGASAFSQGRQSHNYGGSSSSYNPGTVHTLMSFKGQYDFRIAIKDIFADELKQDKEYVS